MTTKTRAPRAPKDLAATGRRLWLAVQADLELDPHEELLLLQACRCADRLEDIATRLVRAPLTTTNARGDEVPNPLLVEQRMQGAALARLFASLRMPTGDESADGGLQRPQRRGAARGPYRLPSVE